MNPEELDKKIKELKAERTRLYNQVKDFTVSANKTSRIESQLKDLTSEINALEKKRKKALTNLGASEFKAKKQEWASQ